MARHAVPRSAAAGPLSSSWPPGSNVTRLPPGRGEERRAATAAGDGEGASRVARIHSSSIPTRPPGELPRAERKTSSSTYRWTSATDRERVGAGTATGARSGRRPRSGSEPARTRDTRSSWDSSGLGGSGARPRRIVDRDVTTGLRPCGAPNVARHSEVRPYPDGGFHTPYCAAGAARASRPSGTRRSSCTTASPCSRRDPWVARFGLFRQLGALVRGPGGPGRGHPRCGRGVVLARPPRPPEPGVAPAVPRRPHPAARPRRRPDRPRAHPRRLPRRGAGRPDVGADLRPGAGAVHRRRGSGRGVADRRRRPPRREPERRAGSRVGAPGEAGDPCISRSRSCCA